MTHNETFEISETHQRIMLQRMSEERLDKLLGDLPYIQKIKTQAEAKTRAEFWAEAEAKTRLQTLRSTILDMVQVRFNMNDATLHQVETLLMQQEQTQLDDLFQIALRAENFAEFWAQAEQMESVV